jgi:hypothetical protein
MRGLIKKIFLSLPNFLRRLFLNAHEAYFKILCLVKEKKEYNLQEISKVNNNSEKKNILIYHIEGLGFGGTQKTLQLLANNLCGKYNVFFLYSRETKEKTRKGYLDERITLLPFTYKETEPHYPFYIKGMNPHIKQVIADKQIDLLITADSGYTQYPFSTIDSIPIIMINIFGSPTLQKNIISSVFISHEVKTHSEKYTGPVSSNEVVYLSTPEPIPEARDRASEIRKQFLIKEDAFVFGRIGRGSDSIFDPIGIRSFQTIVKKYPDVHYIIMSPPPIVEKIVREETIPNVHFLLASAEELEIWGFHLAINSLAHFRKDGETFGLNIAESMYAGNPIISHKSLFWNAHLEYLSNEFSRVADIDDVKGYTNFMEEYILLHTTNKNIWGNMSRAAKNKAESLFSKKEYTKHMETIIDKALSL